MTDHGLIDLLKNVKWDHFHFWGWLHNLIAPLGAVLGKFIHSWVKRRNARLAQHWPVTDGQVKDIDVAAGTKFFGSPRKFNATFKYSYAVRDSDEVSYYHGEYSRPFPDKELAWEWLELLKNKRIRVHYQPGHPELSAVLAADLDAHFALPARTPADLLDYAPGIDAQ
ncbi:MAG: DUF3592 domain-containing protein [Terracidiphilus sp.]